MSIRRFIWLLALVALAFVVTIFFKPLSPRALITNPLFAIGFGAPLVLHLSSLPKWKELAATAVLGIVVTLVVVQLAQQNQFPQWIFGFGVASTIVLAIRRNLLFLLPSLITLIFTLEVSLFLEIISTYPPLTYDALAYVADASFGAPISFRVGQMFVTYPIIGAICTAIYLAPPPGLIFVYALQAKAKEPPEIDIVTALLAMGVAGYALYFLFPACGPKFVFPSFPNHPPDAAKLTGVILRGPFAPRNAVPSLHMASAFIAFIHARRLGRVATLVAAIFVIGTFFGTMGTGEHYFVDLVVALPFTVAMHALLERRFVHVIAPTVVYFVWLWVMRFHGDVTWLVWLMLLAAIVSTAGGLRARRSTSLRVERASESAA